MVKKKKISIFMAIGVFFFLFLMYSMFPFFILKEVVINKVQSELRQNGIYLNIQVQSAKFYWWTGIEFKNVNLGQIQNQDTIPVDFEKLTARVSLFPLLIGNLNINVSVYQKEDGRATFFFSFPLFSTLFGNADIRKAEAHFSEFSIHEIASQLLASLGSQKNVTISFIAPILLDTNVGGYLDGDADFVNSSSRKTAKIDLLLNKAYLDLNNKSLNVPKQNFKDAVVHLSWDGVSVVIQKGSKLRSENILVETSGTFTPSVEKNGPVQANLNMKLDLSGEVEKNYGFLVQQLLKCPNSTVLGGMMTFQLLGPVNNLICQ